MLLICALLFFGFFGIAAVVIDMGLVRVTQRQMQSAADTAALEGLRSRDQNLAFCEMNGLNPQQCDTLGLDEKQCNDLGLSEEQCESFRLTNRRTIAAAMAQAASLNGAGPDVKLSGGLGDPFNSSQLIEPSNFGPYTPTPVDLQTNAANRPHGDMVSGVYCPDPAGCDHSEAPDYTRADLSAPDPTQAAPSFLVRLRRTNDFQGLDNVDGVSSTGPPIPFLFGRGTAIRKNDDPDVGNPNDYDPRTNGLTVRATAIADARPAMRIGTAADPLGMMPFSLNRSCWNVLPPRSPILIASVCPLPTEPTGRPANTVGMGVSTGQQPADGIGYVAIFDTNLHCVDPNDPLNPNTFCVVGFGLVQYSGLSITRLDSQVAANASAVLTGPLPIPASILLKPAEGALLAPVLVH